MKITRRGVEMNTVGALPAVNSQAPVLTNLMSKDWEIFQSNEAIKGKYLVLNIFPSVDTPTCAKTVRAFNLAAEKLGNAAVLCISKDLPPALNRFCAAEGIKNVIPLSAYRDDCNFGNAYGVRITDGAGAAGAFKDLFARALLVIDPQGKIVYSELVTELANEPKYDAALACIPSKKVSKDAADNQTVAAAAGTPAATFTVTAAAANPLSSVSDNTATAGQTANQAAAGPAILSQLQLQAQNNSGKLDKSNNSAGVAGPAVVTSAPKA